MMSISDSRIRVRCSQRGVAVVCRGVEALESFNAAQFAWCLPPDIYRYLVAGKEGAAQVSTKVQPAARMFGLQLHSRGLRPLTKHAYEQLIGKDLTDRNFQKMAARFGSFYKGLPVKERPYYAYDFDSDRVVRNGLAYVMRADVEWFVVFGVDPECGLTDDDVDWGAFVPQPPPPK